MYQGFTPHTKCWLFTHAPAEVEPLEVRCAHPVRLSPATHSQGHGRPCLQRLHLRRDFTRHIVFPDGFSVTCDYLHARHRNTSHFQISAFFSVAGRDHAVGLQWADLQLVIKTWRGNEAKKRLRFHALVKLVSDYQRVTDSPVAASRRGD